MATINVGPLGRIGLVADAAPQEMPDLAWSDCQNVRFGNGTIAQSDGYSTLVDEPSVTPTHIISVAQPNSTSDLLVWFTQNNTAHAWDNENATGAEITNASITGSSSAYAWSTTLLSGVLVATNGSDPPQRWVFPPDTGTLLVDLDNWTATHSCRIIRAFRQHLFALDTTEDGTRYPYRVKWSDPAEPGTVPGSWDEADVAGDAGTFDLIEGGDIIVDALPLKDQFFIYKENSVWAARYVGGVSIWNFSQVFNGWGLMAKHAVCEANANHYLVTRTDVLQHNGYDVKSIATGRVKDFLTESIDPASIQSTQAAHYKARNEVWFCFNDGGATIGNTKALVWNYKFETWSLIELPAALSLTITTVTAVADTSTWDEEVAYDWNAGPVNQWSGTAIYPIDQLAFIDFNNTNISRFTQNDFAVTGGTQLCVIERVGFPLSGYRRDGSMVTVDTRIKYVKRLWPRVRVRNPSANTDMNFYIGYRFHMGESITWKGPYSYDPLQDKKLDVRVSGREISIRIQTNNRSGWELDSLDIEYDVDSRH